MRRRAKLSLSPPQAEIQKRPDNSMKVSVSPQAQRRDVQKERTANPPEPSRPPYSTRDKTQKPPTGTQPVNERDPGNKRLQSLTADEFFYFFLRMRKGEVKRIVGMLQSRYPEENPVELSKRLIASKTRLALLGGTLLSLPLLLPGIGQTLKFAGIVGATSMLTRMNLYLINEIALAFGEDIDNKARVGDMMAVVGATALGAAAPGIVAQSVGLNPWLRLPTGAFSSAGMTQLIGQTAIRHFRRKAMARKAIPEELNASASA